MYSSSGPTTPAPRRTPALLRMLFNSRRLGGVLSGVSLQCSATWATTRARVIDCLTRATVRRKVLNLRSSVVPKSRLARQHDVFGARTVLTNQGLDLRILFIIFPSRASLHAFKHKMAGTKSIRLLCLILAREETSRTSRRRKRRRRKSRRTMRRKTRDRSSVARRGGGEENEEDEVEEAKEDGGRGGGRGG